MRFDQAVETLINYDDIVEENPSLHRGQACRPAPRRRQAETSGRRHPPLCSSYDDPVVRRFITDTLDALGYNAMGTENGFAGLAALERSTPDLLLVDFAIPGMNGAQPLSIAEPGPEGYCSPAAMPALTRSALRSAARRHAAQVVPD